MISEIDIWGDRLMADGRQVGVLSGEPIDLNRFRDLIAEIRHDPRSESRPDLEGEIDDLGATVGSLECENGGLRDEIEDLEAERDELREKIAALEAELGAK